jgi:hypothetical protein
MFLPESPLAINKGLEVVCNFPKLRTLDSSFAGKSISTAGVLSVDLILDPGLVQSLLLVCSVLGEVKSLFFLLDLLCFFYCDAIRATLFVFLLL